MNHSPDRLFELLPVVYRVRDAERRYPLRSLLRVIDEQASVIEQDLDRAYDNWFIETCDDWAVPYIADLIGYRAVSDGSGLDDVATPEGRLARRIVVPRREVAHTLGFRRRKGTLALLELLARDAADWPARAVEFYALLGWTQHLNHLRPNRARSVDLRDGDALALLDGPFERSGHGVDVRRVISHRALGRHNIPSVGVFVWRLRAYSVTHAPAYCLESEAPNCFTFSALGHNTQLHRRPEPETDPTHIAGERELPVPIRRRALEERLSERPRKTQASGAHYGRSKSLAIYAPDWPVKGAPQPIARDHVIAADLTRWRHRAQRNQVAVDPVLGRIAFPAGQMPRHGVWVDYHYAFSADMGAGEYDRSLSQPLAFARYRVSKTHHGGGHDNPAFATIGEAIAQWRKDQQALAAAKPPDSADEASKAQWSAEMTTLRAAVVEVEDSEVYSEPLAIALEAGESLQLRAANRKRPVLRLLDYMTSRTDPFAISGRRGSRFKLDGFVVTGRSVQIAGPDRSDAERHAQGDLCDVQIRHCTLVPGWGLDCDCEPERPNEPSLEVFDSTARVIIEHSIIGSIEVLANEVATDPVDIAVSDSIVDATSEARVAIGAVDLPLAFARLTILRSTVIGEVNAHAIALAENSIFMSVVRAGRRQIGCVRFCYVTPGSRTPRRYHCQPDLARAAVAETTPPLSADDRTAAQARETERIRPDFNALRYGAPDYCQLADACAGEIKCGADDESEMGVFHDLFQPQREANLRARLDEFTPAGMEAGILFAS